MNSPIIKRMNVCFFLLVLLVAVPGCLGESASEDRRCDPGEIDDCHCDDGTEGERECSDDGMDWSGCSCYSADGDRDSDGDSDRCPTGFYWNGEMCVPGDDPNDHDCPTGFYWNGEMCAPGDDPNDHECPTGFYWNGEACVPGEDPDGDYPDGDCTATCEGRECGDDGCGGSCGECLRGECVGFQCLMPPGTHFDEPAESWSVPEGGRKDGGFDKTGGGVPGGEYYYGWESWVTMDINGDYLPDLVVTSTSSAKDGYYYWDRVFSDDDGGYWKVYFNSEDGFQENAVKWRVPDGGKKDGGFDKTGGGVPGGEYYYGWESWTTMDIDGDRLPDLVVTSTSSAKDGYYYWDRVFSDDDGAYWKVFKNNGSGFEMNAVKWRVPEGGRKDGGFDKTGGGVPGGEYYYGWESWSTVDMTGDGLPDLVVTSTSSAKDGYYYWDRVFTDDDGAYWKVFENTGSGFEMTANKWRVPEGGRKDGGFDKTGGGVPGGEYYYGWESWTTMDIDGDRLPDLVVTSTSSAKDGYYYWDRVFSDDDGAYWKVFGNTGSGFAMRADKWRVPDGGRKDGGFDKTGGGVPGGEYYYGWESWSTVDMTGDGLPDLVVTSTSSAKDGYYYWDRVFSDDDGAYWKVFENTGSAFAASRDKWRVPEGGKKDGGFDKLGGGVPGGEYYYGWESWATLDLTGDGLLDLVVTSTSSAKDGYYYWDRVLGWANDDLHWNVFPGTP